MAARPRTLNVGDCALRVRDAQCELDDARRELEAAILAAGWVELQRHTDVSGAARVIYTHADREAGVDPITGMAVTGTRVATLADFVGGTVP